MFTKQTLVYMHRSSARPIAQAFLFSALLVGGEYSVAQSSELASPNGDYTVQIVSRPLPHADSVTGDSILVLLERGRPIIKVPTTGYLINAIWSPNGRYVAVNNRRGNSGDYVWVFSLDGARSLKRPDDDSFAVPSKKISRICSECDESSFDKDLAIAKSWRSGDELEVEMRWRFYKTALIVGHSVFKVSGHKIKLVEEKVSRHPVDWQPPQN
jgi:hypothetical protein